MKTTKKFRNGISTELGFPLHPILLPNEKLENILFMLVFN